CGVLTVLSAVAMRDIVILVVMLKTNAGAVAKRGKKIVTGEEMKGRDRSMANEGQEDGGFLRWRRLSRLERNRVRKEVV
ncbi:hypothetical protein A2U01_0075149, partial [Trifolium medium]|nr:hypothetical protein [Trifolium medium]